MKKKKVLIILLCVIALIFVGAKIMLNGLVDEVKNIPVSNLDMENVEDGTYVGEYSITPVYVKVEVVVEGHKITDINILEHQNGLGSKAEVIVSDVIKEQTLEVDAVSGATASSKCILKAVENALENYK